MFENIFIGNDEQDLIGLLLGIVGSGIFINGESVNGVIVVGLVMFNGVVVCGLVCIRLDLVVLGVNWVNYLNIDWDGDGDIDVDDSLLVDLFFGIYCGNDCIIYMCEGF